MIKTKVKSKISEYRSALLWTGLFVVIFYLLFPGVDAIKSTLEEIKGASLEPIILGNIIFYFTIVLYTVQIVVLAQKRLNNWIAFKVQMSVLFINKLLPSAISSFVMNSFYLYKTGHKSPQVASVIAMKAATSSITFTILFIFSLILGITQFNLNGLLSGGQNLDEVFKILLILFAVVSIVAFVIYHSDRAKNYIKKSIDNFWKQFKTYSTRKTDIFWALMTGFFAPALGVLILLLSAKSVDLNLSFTQAFLIYTLGTTMANVIPIPGGVGAAEAGLYAGFIIFGFPSDSSMAAVTIYRIITFWIPTIPGVIFFVNLKDNFLKNFSLKWSLPSSKA